VTLMMFMAAAQVSAGDMTLGELVMITPICIQLFVPLVFSALSTARFARLGKPISETAFRLARFARSRVADAPDASR